MSGKRITAQQRAFYMKFRQQDMTQSLSAAKAGISERSGRRIEKNTPSKSSSSKSRTRKDPFETIWPQVLEPMLLNESDLTGLTLWEYLDDNYPGIYPYSCLRTLQRRVKHFRHTQGPCPEVIFRQSIPVGLQGLSDFTRPNTKVTIKGEPFEHLIYQFRLAYSGWRFAMIVQGGESYAALSEGLQNALTTLGGVPEEHRTDSLSAAYNNHHDKQDFTEHYQKLCENYGMKPTRNNLGIAHENGAIETVHGALKHRIDQAIKVRGSADFSSISDYQAFIDQIVQRLNRRTSAKIIEEKAALRPLPDHGYMNYTPCMVKVTSSATITIKRVLYSVPARLIGAKIEVRVHHDRLIGYLAQTKVFELTRIHPNHHQREKSINWRHLIEALSRKPQAFRYSEHRDQLLPDDNYKSIWQLIDAKLESYDACKWMVYVLAMAAKREDWRQLGQDLLAEVKHSIPSLTQLQSRQLPDTQAVTDNQVKQHDLAPYDLFIHNSQGVAVSCYH